MKNVSRAFGNIMRMMDLSSLFCVVRLFKAAVKFSLSRRFKCLLGRSPRRVTPGRPIWGRGSTHALASGGGASSLLPLVLLPTLVTWIQSSKGSSCCCFWSCCPCLIILHVSWPITCSVIHQTDLPCGPSWEPGAQQWRKKGSCPYAVSVSLHTLRRG